MHLLFVINSLKIGGAEQATVALAKQFSREHAVRIATIDPIEVVIDCIGFGIEVVALCPPNVAGSKHKALPSRIFFAAKKLRNLAAENPQTVMISGLHRANYTAALARILSGFSIVQVAVVHSNLTNRSSQISRVVHQALHWMLLIIANQVVAVSGSVCRSIHAARLFHQKMKVIGNPVTPATSEISSALESPYPSVDALEQPANILLMGRMTTIKNVGMAVRMIEGVNRTHPARLHLVGPIEDEETKQIICQATARNEHILYHGWTTTPAAYVAHADCVVLTSWNESFGLVLVEAMSAGVPVVTTDCGGPREIVGLLESTREEHQQSKEEYLLGSRGMLVPKDDDKAMTRAIVHLLSRPTLREGFASSGRDYVKAHSVQAIAARFEKLIRKEVD